MQHTVTYNHQSQFIEMFGKYASTTRLEDLSETIIAGGDKPKDCTTDRTESNVYPVIANGIENDGIIGYSSSYRINSLSLTISARGTIGVTAIRSGMYTPIIRLIVIKPLRNINLTYLKYQLDYNGFQPTGAVQGQLTVPNVKNKMIPVPPLSEQEEFAAIVRQADKSKFDGFKSQFIEHFRCDQCAYLPLREVCLRYGEYGSNTPSIPFEEGHPRYIRITDLNYDGTLNDDKVCAKEIDKKYILSKGDFLFARTGATVGKTYCHREGDALYAGYLIRYVTNPDKILPEFLSIYTKTQPFWSWIQGQMKIGAQPNISSKQYNELPVPAPSIEEQTSFLSFVRQADKSKYYVQNKLNYICHILTKQIPLRRCS